MLRNAPLMRRQIWHAAAAFFVALFLIGFLASLFLWGYLTGRQGAEARATKQIAALHVEHAQAVQHAQTIAINRMRYEAKRANDLAALLLAEKTAHGITARALRERSPHVNREYRPALDAPPQPVRNGVLTVGWLREYNLALGADPLPEPFAAAAAVLPPDRAAEFDSLESGTTPQDILAHAADYGAWCLGLADQVNALLDHLEVP